MEPFDKTPVLLVGAFDQAMHAHTALRARALERLGCPVTSFNLVGQGGLLNRLRRLGLRDRMTRVLREANPAVVLVLEGVQLPSELVAELKQVNRAVWINWFCDERRTRASVAALAAAYDVVFVAGSSVAESEESVGLPPLRYLPPGCDPSVHRPMRSRDQFRANVVFAGTATPHREGLLSELVEFGLAVWGPGWRRTRLRDYCRGELLEHGDYIRAYAGASVAVNVQCSGESGAADPGCNRRLFELAAIGVPQVVEDRPDIHRHFREGSEILVARSVTDFKGLLAEALQDRAWSEQVAVSARQRALKEHTYMHRLATMLREVGEMNPQPAW
jgi:spore maturation protein CgeB